MINLSKKEKGFTLIELMIVVAIIGILAAIAIPQFSSYREKAFDSAAEADLRNLMTAQEAAYADTQAYVAIATMIGSKTIATNTITGLAGAKLSKGVTAKEAAAPTATTYDMDVKHVNGVKKFNGKASAGITSTTAVAGKDVTGA